MRPVGDILRILKVAAVVAAVVLLLALIRDPLAVLAAVGAGAAAIFRPGQPGDGPRRTGSGNIPGDSPSGDGPGAPADSGDTRPSGPRRRRR